MKLIAILSLLLFSQISFGQQVDIKEDLDSIVMAMASYGGYISEQRAWVGGMTDQWSRYEVLKKDASDEFLIKLTNHENAAVKCYSFMALADRKHPKTFQVLVDHTKDQQEIYTSRGCLVAREKINQFFLNVVTPDIRQVEGYTMDEDQKIAFDNENLFSEDRGFDANARMVGSMVDSIMLFDDDVRDYGMKMNLFKRIEPKPHYYDRIKAIFEKEHWNSCLSAIAKYRKQEDVDFLIEQMKHPNGHRRTAAVRAVGFFPDDAFFGILKSYHQEVLNYETPNHYLIGALNFTLVQYKDEKSKALIERTLRHPDKAHVEANSKCIWLALTIYPDPIYADIFERVKISDEEKSKYKWRLAQPHWIW